MTEMFLAHHGVKGQKWGVRRYQNPDGTLTAQGRAHYGMTEGLREINKAGITKDKQGNRKYAGQQYGQQAFDVAAKTTRAVSYFDAEEKQDNYERVIRTLEVLGGIATAAAVIAPYAAAGAKAIGKINASKVNKTNAKQHATKYRMVSQGQTMSMHPNNPNGRTTTSMYDNYMSKTKAQRKIMSSPYARYSFR